MAVENAIHRVAVAVPIALVTGGACASDRCGRCEL
jgi:hypothetical protein